MNYAFFLNRSPARMQPLAIGMFALAVLVSSSCKLDDTGNSFQAMARPRLPLGVPDELKNTAWKASTAADGTPCSYYVIFTASTRIDAVECNNKLSFSEYLSGFRVEQPRETAAETSAGFPPGAPQFQLSSEGLQSSSCQRSADPKTQSFELEGHTFYAMLGSGNSAGSVSRAMKTWTRKVINNVAYSEIEFDAAKQVLARAGCL